MTDTILQIQTQNDQPQLFTPSETFAFCSRAIWKELQYQQNENLIQSELRI